MQKLLLLAAALVVVASVAAPAAAFTTTAQPDAAYQAATTLIPITAQDYTLLTSVTDGTQTVNFGAEVSALTRGISWATWNVPPEAELASPRILWTGQAQALTMSFSQAASMFGFEAEPNTGAQFDMTADFYNGASLVGSVIRNVSGSGGSLLFAAADPGGFTSVVMTTTDANGFGVAQLRYELAAPPVPEPASVVLVTGSLLGLLARRRRA